MNTPDALLARLDAIGQTLAEKASGLALIGLGSVGTELDRLDSYSDLDFFAIVEPGAKPRYLEQLDWLSAACPIAYQFRNTRDGYKVLFADGIFCEFAVFEPDELATIPFVRGRIVWKQPHVPDTIGASVLPIPAAADHGADWLVGEALTNLYVGLGRYRRGEKLAAARLIQQHAVDRVLTLAATFERELLGHTDIFAPERRVERRFPDLARALPGFIQGYDRSCESALAILSFLEARVSVNAQLAAAIRSLCVEPG